MHVNCVNTVYNNIKALQEQLVELPADEFHKAIRCLNMAMSSAQKSFAPELSREVVMRNKYDDIITKLDRGSNMFANIDMFYNQMFNRCIRGRFDLAGIGHTLLVKLPISVLMFICCLLPPNELQDLTCLKPVAVTAQLLINKFHHLHVPEAVWRKANFWLTMEMNLYLAAQARVERGQAWIVFPSVEATKKRNDLFVKSTDSLDELIYCTDGSCTPVRPISLVRFAHAHGTRLRSVQLIAPTDTGVIPDIQFDASSYFALVDYLKWEWGVEEREARMQQALKQTAELEKKQDEFAQEYEEFEERKEKELEMEMAVARAIEAQKNREKNKVKERVMHKAIQKALEYEKEKVVDKAIEQLFEYEKKGKGKGKGNEDEPDYEYVTRGEDQSEDEAAMLASLTISPKH